MMKITSYLILIPLLLGTFFLASCRKDKENQFIEDRISIQESVVDEESADAAALKLIDIDLNELKYENEHFRTKVNFKKLIRKAEEKNYYNSEKLKETLRN